MTTILNASKRELIEITPEVSDALAAHRGVVALESTIITHGMPYPQNIETARMVESVVRVEGAVPATIAVIGGRIKVGLAPDELEQLGDAKGASKASRRDLAALVVKRASAGTTVAATMAIAAQAGIPIFATGGIGGVHRGAEHTFDISADLVELGANEVAVVCAGCKSILDIPKTLEFLETQSVPVIGYRTDEFPAFFARSCGHKLEHRFDDPGAMADVIVAQRQLGLKGGILIGNPIPEADALPAAAVEAQIAAACAEAEKKGIGAKALTPFLLARINEMTGGKSLQANIALIRNNASVAAQIAGELSRRVAR